MKHLVSSFKSIHTVYNKPNRATCHVNASRRRLPEEGFCFVYDALVGVVVGVGEEHVPLVRQGVWVDSEAVVLTGDEAATCPVVDARLVVATVTIPEKRANKIKIYIFKIQIF